MRIKPLIFKPFISILPYLFVFITSLNMPSDPDLGWHLKYGEFIDQHHKLLWHNTFSTMMPNFYWVNGSWGTDYGTYLIYKAGGFLGLSLASALVITLTFYFSARAARLTLGDEALFFPLLAYLESPINVVSFRGQQISLLFMSILFYILSKYTFLSKKLCFVPLLFLIWSNIHEQFLLSLGLFVGWIAITLIRDYFYLLNKRHIIKEAFYLGLIFLFSFSVTFITPTGTSAIYDAYIHFGNPLLKDIVEYLPFQMFSQNWWNQIIVCALIILGLGIMFLTNRIKHNLPVLAIVFLLTLLSIEVRRYAWSAYYLIPAFLAPIGPLLHPHGKNSTMIFTCILFIIFTPIAVSEKVPVKQFFIMTWDTYCANTNVLCSPRSAEFIKEHKLAYNLFSLYGWGGWLIWQYPDIKPSIDGRMHLWKNEKGYSAFAEYFDYEQDKKNIDSSEWDVVYMSPDKPIYKHLLKLTKEGKWTLVYEDNLAGVFVRNNRIRNRGL